MFILQQLSSFLDPSSLNVSDYWTRWYAQRVSHEPPHFQIFEWWFIIGGILKL